MKTLTVQEVEAAIGLPAAEWKARCFEIACRIVAAKLVEGEAVYGHWTGPIARASMFADKREFGFCQHGWVRLTDGTVLDPTRWVFEAAEPYIFVGHADDNNQRCVCGHEAFDHDGLNDCTLCACEQFDEPPWPYDEGGNRLRAAMESPPPRPTGERTVTLRLPENAAWFYRLMLGDNEAFPGVTQAQAFWLANRSYDRLGHFVHLLYVALQAADLGAFIPLDNRKRSDREWPPERAFTASAEEVADYLRAAGGDPKKIGQDGKAFVEALLARRRAAR